VASVVFAEGILTAAKKKEDFKPLLRSNSTLYQNNNMSCL